MNTDTETKIKAAAFDKIVKHFQDNPDIQNIDLMINGKFCRNCIYKWYKSVAEELGENISVEDAQEKIYGMSYLDYKKQHQTPASPEKLKAFEQLYKSIK